ncbi:MAG: radical SAM protein, partial [Planctomycetes bacterium]|nr:radical SAM protein [Planctomycetota bacterium]
RYAPYCVLPGLEQHIVGLVGNPYDPVEWRNRACSYDQPPEYCAAPLPLGEAFRKKPLEPEYIGGVRVVAQRGARLKVFPEKCATCAAMEVCDGLSPLYLERFGDAELKPYSTFPMEGPLPAARIGYRRAFRYKAAPPVNMG